MKYVVEGHEARQGSAGIHMSIPLECFQDRFQLYRPLSLLIKQTRDLLVTDPWDKVYGVPTLANLPSNSDSGQSAVEIYRRLRPGFGVSAKTSIREAVKAIIEDEGKLDAMLEPSQWSFSETTSTGEDWPSWVPRYDLHRDWQDTDAETLAFAPLYRAHNGFPAMVQSLPSPSNQDISLVAGLPIDKVKYVVARFDRIEENILMAVKEVSKHLREQSDDPDAVRKRVMVTAIAGALN